MLEQSLINRGLDQREARIVVFISRKRLADVSVIARSTRMPTDQCQLVIAELVRKGILRRSTNSMGVPVYSLSSYFNNLLRADEEGEGSAPFHKKLFPVAHHHIKLPQ